VRANESIGIALEFANSNLIERNVVSGNGSGGIFTVGGISVFRGIGNQILHNAVRGNMPFGVLLTQAQNTRVERNKADRNTDDGIHVDSGAGDLLAGNTVNHNGDYGIEGSPTVVDGGGNKARGNGNPAQCLNVACK
jgi:large repetitive protein